MYSICKYILNKNAIFKERYLLKRFPLFFIFYFITMFADICIVFNFRREKNYVVKRPIIVKKVFLTTSSPSLSFSFV